MPAMANDTEPLLSAYHFNYTQRPRRDKAWALAYYLLLLLTLGWALINLILRPDLLAVLSSPDYLDDPHRCPIKLTSASNSNTPTGAAAFLTRAAAAAREAVAPAARRRASAVAGTLLDPGLHEQGRPQTQPGGLQHHYLQSDDAASDVNPPSLAASDPSDQSARLNAGDVSTHAVTALDPIFDLGRDVDLDPDSDLDLAAHRRVSDDGPVPRVLLDYGGQLLLMSLGAALALAFVFVLALRWSPWALVLLACGLQVGAPLASAMVASKQGNSSLALILLLLAAAIAVSLYCGRKALGLASRLLGLAAVALRDNPTLLGLVAALKMALAGATALLLVAAAVVGAAGELVPNPLRDGKPDCATPDGVRVTCCALAPSAALPAYLPAAAVTLAWTLLLMFELKVFVVAGVVAQWYFSPAGHLAGGGYHPPVGSRGGGAAGGGGADGGLEGGSIGGDVVVMGGGGGGGGLLGPGIGGYSSGRALVASLGHALGPSFGSLCAASGVLGATAYLRAVINGVMSRSRRNPALKFGPGACASGLFVCLAGLLGCCCWCVVVLVEQLSKFATVQMAMSGLGFWRASQEAVALLRRNFMDAYNMWWYMPMVLHCGAAAFAAAWGYVAYWLARQCWAPFTHAAPLDAAAAAALGALAAATAELVLSFVCSVLVNISDALFICFVLDRDSAAVTWYDLHCVLATLPCCAAARSAAEAHYAAAGHSHHHGGGGGGLGVDPYGSVPPPTYFYLPSASAYSGSYAPYGYQAPAGAPGGVGGSVAQLGQPLGYGQPRPQYSSGYGGGSGGGFWGWLRSPGGSGSGVYGMPVGGSRYRNDRPQYPPPAVLSPPYSDQRFPHLGPSPPPPFFGSPPPSARPM
ncbi:hypothetical protein PLESTB_001767000 [Pleodorina starrii]|uniref:Uncharacterized protein n=1 Tax=Pleodorina starrii TaxID=330485 RepID=A0A9W6C0H3_9CHLO|nr:hypothetical protein PLESTM_001862200 [Pleodorina starrii]GLC61534.1 hypothetical protein PLESTB_001767000 [Pleodorina starrii]GLC76814.1 hypothetical protein PLESTF_001844000 [Pleodorina starrii]